MLRSLSRRPRAFCLIAVSTYCTSHPLHTEEMTALSWLGVMTFSQERPDALVEQMTHDALPSRAEPSALMYIAYIS
jgi:hypothetical protein